MLPKTAVCVPWNNGLLTDLLESGHPACGQVAILEYNPCTLSEGFVNHLRRYWSLTLT